MTNSDDNGVPEKKEAAKAASPKAEAAKVEAARKAAFAAARAEK